ncbi:MAG TPA: M1 family aminopeptidase [Blastocatellia bacterium]|nr:M1 family aminopeptidase [Blastocatellia bacterium]
MTLTLSRRTLASLVISAAALLAVPSAAAPQDLSAKGKQLYDQIKAFSLTGGSASVEALVLKRDRAEMTFDGTFFFAAPVEGRVTGAVFIGQGRFRAEVPPSDFEKENVRRMLKADVVESDFKTAVLRFTDDAFDMLGEHRREGGLSSAEAQKLAADLDPRLLKETGANLSARLALSILNAEKPGLFFANFDGGKRGRFSLVIDHQTRVPAANFAINGGEKGIIFAYRIPYGNDIWMAFYSLENYQRKAAAYSDTNNLIDIGRYQLDLDLLDPKKRLRLVARLAMESRQANLRAVSFLIGESLSEYESQRLKKQMRVKAVRSRGAELAAVQEDWEGGLTVFLNTPAQAGERFDIEFEFEGDFMYDAQSVSNCYYPLSNVAWLPRHGFLDRATFDLTFHHRKRLRIASGGLRVSEGPDPSDNDAMVTRYKIDVPVDLVTFALAPFERHTQMVKWDKGGDPIPVEFNSLPGSQIAIKEDFILAELDNSLRYFTVLFGKYPYPAFGAAFHPFGFGQGFPSLLMIPGTDRASKFTYAFIAHETAHQWWGDIVAWRSYRDQWLSEGFAEYSGILYTGLRESPKAADEMIRLLRRSLIEPPRTFTGIGPGKLDDVGPIVLGHRLNTTKTLGAYTALIYDKGALVLRMLHFLMSNPASGDDKAFFAMMTDFVEKHRNGVASTEDFQALANEHFARTPTARKYKLTDLNWFFKQWVYQTGLPTYQLEYQIVSQPDGSVIVSGNVTQENVPDDWFMPLPLVFTFSGNQAARGTIPALGKKTPFELKLPMKPQKVELDPESWILSEKTSAKSR